MSEQPIGLIHSVGITHSLVITPTSVHARRMLLGLRERSSTAYLGSKSTATEDQRRIAQVMMEQINQAKFNIIERHEKDKEFSAEKESILRVTLKLPGAFRAGHVVFKTLGEEFKVSFNPTSSKVENARNIVKVLVPSLLEFAPDRFYDEESGKLVTELLQEGSRWAEGLNFSWKPEKPRS